MQKKLLAVAVAGALVSPLAMAQSAVTISGAFKMSIDNYRLGNIAAANARANSSETRVTDNSSAIHFNVTEDMGGGLAAIGKLDVRFAPDTGALAGSGNTWVGVRSNNLGSLTFGRHDLHYGKQPDEVAVKGALQGSSNALMDYIGNTAIANATRTANVVRWDSPNWSGFNLTVAYSANGVGTASAEADLTASATSIRKGAAWNFNPSYTASNWQIGYSYWNAKPDAITTADQKSNVIYGFYRLGAFKLGAAYKTDKIDGTAGTVGDRKAWSIPVAWFAGPHTIALTYTRAGDDDATPGVDDKANMIAAAYSYDLSKRTALSLTYARISNNAGATYDLFSNTATTGSTNAQTFAGEDPRLISFTVRHAF
jgi:predicted porin